jgi:hypothetical protein
MLTLYLACLIFGGSLVAVSILGGLDSHDVDVHADVDVHVDADHGDIPSADHHAVGEHGMAEAARFMSFRSLVFFTAFFGLTGSMLTWIETPFVLTLLASIGMGGIAAAGIQSTLAYLKRTESGRVLNLRDIEGLKATVIVGVARGKRGKIRVATTEQFLQLLATVADESKRAEFSAGDVVTVVRVEDDLAQVSEENFIR